MSSIPENSTPKIGLAEYLAEQGYVEVRPGWERKGKGFEATVCGIRLFVCPTKRGDRWCINYDGEWFKETFETRDDAMDYAQQSAEGW